MGIRRPPIYMRASLVNGKNHSVKDENDAPPHRHSSTRPVHLPVHETLIELARLLAWLAPVGENESEVWTTSLVVLR